MNTMGNEKVVRCKHAATVISRNTLHYVTLCCPTRVQKQSKHHGISIEHSPSFTPVHNYPGKRPQTVKSRDLDALGSREVMVVMRVGIVVMVAVVRVWVWVWV